MKSFVLALALALTILPSVASETKRVCVEQKDQKTGKVKEVCKEIKVHKKLEPTTPPSPKK